MFARTRSAVAELAVVVLAPRVDAAVAAEREAVPEAERRLDDLGRPLDLRGGRRGRTRDVGARS